MGFEPTTFSLARRRSTTEPRPQVLAVLAGRECRDPGSNWGHRDFQSRALPTELSRPDILVIKRAKFYLTNDELSSKCPRMITSIHRPVFSIPHTILKPAMCIQTSERNMETTICGPARAPWHSSSSPTEWSGPQRRRNHSLDPPCYAHYNSKPSAMFESLTQRLNQVFDQLRRRGKLSEADVDSAMREVRLALLEADVHFSVVKTLVGRVRERAVGAEVSKALNPGQQVIKIVNEELIATLGEAAPLNLTGPRPRVIMLMGLQGSGKTTTAGKACAPAAFEGRARHAGGGRSLSPGRGPTIAAAGRAPRGAG